MAKLREYIYISVSILGFNRKVIRWWVSFAINGVNRNMYNLFNFHKIRKLEALFFFNYSSSFISKKKPESPLPLDFVNLI